MSIREKGRKRLNNIGFTLVEMMVVLTMMTIVLGVSAWGVTGWIQHSEFLKNEANAQTIYLAAQSALSNADSKGTSDSIISRIYNEANAKGNFIDASETSKKTEYGIPTLADNEGNMHRYAALTVTKGQYSSGDDSVLFDIISPYIFDTEALNGTITVEFDLYSKSVYSVFYSAWSTEMAYGPGTNVARGKFYINAVNRTEAVRSDLAMGYYAVDQVNVALLDAETLRLSNVTLNNEETLNLRFGSNSKLGDLDTIYDISFYEQKPGESVQKDDDEHFLFSVSIDNNNIVGGEDVNTGDPKNRIKSKCFIFQE
ncbi:MAG: prepilin-type N-terminal cleavage/methylation domain-containing protein [Lachnospiraceae bacterium]|nr:prepilin-type N-terminal cleavage/methylation domain-containing protein [Lachnospiraceae bacterium]